MFVFIEGDSNHFWYNIKNASSKECFSLFLLWAWGPAERRRGESKRAVVELDARCGVHVLFCTRHVKQPRFSGEKRGGVVGNFKR